VVRDDGETKALLAVMKKYGKTRATLAARLMNGKWEWDGGSDEPVPWSYENWAQGQPDHTGQCSELWTTGQWNDVPCNEHRAYLCEVRRPPIESFTFPCSAGVEASLGRHATCRYEIAYAACKCTGVAYECCPDMHWEAAQETCRALGKGAQLAEPRTAMHNQYLASIIRAHGSESCWIGLRKKSASSFEWASGMQLKEEHARWAITEPNGGVGDCVEVWEDGEWNDRGCDIGKPPACEVPVP